MRNSINFGLLLACGVLLHAQDSLQITYPLPDTVIAPGETTQVNVTANAEMKGVTVIGTGPIGFLSGGLTAPPYQFALTIPQKTVPGRYRLTADGLSASGARVASYPVEIDVERGDTPKKITVNHLLLEKKPGEMSSIQVDGEYSDGSHVDLTKSAKTSYVPQSPQIASVSKDGMLTALSPGSTLIVIRHMGLQRILPLTVKPPDR